MSGRTYGEFETPLSMKREDALALARHEGRKEGLTITRIRNLGREGNKRVWKWYGHYRRK